MLPTLLMASAATVQPKLTVVALGCAFSAVVWHVPRLALEAGAVCTLVIRPWLDIFSQRQLGLGPFSLSPSVLYGLTIIFIALTVGVLRAADGRRWWVDRDLLRAHWWLLAAYGIGVASGVIFFGQTGLVQATREVVRLASLVASFLVLLWWVEGEPLARSRAWRYLWMGLVVPLMVAGFQLATHTGFMEPSGIARILGTFSHPNSFAQYLIPFILIAMAYVPAKQSGLRRLGLIVTAVALSIFLVLSYSRTALLVLFVALLALPVLQAGRLGWRALFRSGVVIVLISAIGWLIAGGMIRERFSNISLGQAAVDAVQSGDTQNSFTWRLITWRVLVWMGMEHPVIGHGINMTLVLNPIVDIRNGLPFNAHNDFVRFFFEAGLAGLIAYLMHGVLMFLWVLRRARTVPLFWAPAGYAVAAAYSAIFFLSLGSTELSLNTAGLHGLYGMFALLYAASLPGHASGRGPPA
jgi:putative inorganic carbon (hco3(-)) transporter